MPGEYENLIYKIINEITNPIDKNKVEEAYIFAKQAHEGQKRKSGEAYIIHPISVAVSLWKNYKNIDLLISGLLHDTVEDCEDVSMEYIYKTYGNNIGYIVDGVTKTENNFFYDKKTFIEGKNKIFLGGFNNIGCILVKLADREHNLATLSFMPENKQIKKSFETQALYLPLNNILGFNEKNNSIEKSKEKFENYLKNNKIKNYIELKNKLLNTCFHNFSEDVFKIIYNNSNHVVWEIEDKNFFYELLENGWFDNKAIELISISGDLNDNFIVKFRMKTGYNFNILKKIKLSENTFKM